MLGASNEEHRRRRFDIEEGFGHLKLLAVDGPVEAWKTRRDRYFLRSGN